MLEALTHFDALLFMQINGCHHPMLDTLFLVITQFGNGWIAVPIVGAIIAVVTPRRYLVKALACAAVVGTLAGVANTQIKHAIKRPRPLAYVNDAALQKDSFTVHVVGKPLRRQSFPSGHANTAFAAAAILAFLYRGRFFWAFLPALLIGYSRVYMGAHFPLDVLGGMVVGTAIAALCLLPARLIKILPQRVPLRGSRARQ
jgi:undecaprenyl-diphosphatase